MMGSSLCQKIGVVFMCLAVLVFAGCGGGGVDGLVKEQKTISEEAKAAITAKDVAKIKAAADKQGELMKKVMALSADQQKAFNEKVKKDGVGYPMAP